MFNSIKFNDLRKLFSFGKNGVLLVLFLLSSIIKLNAQDTAFKKMTIHEIFAMAEVASQQLKVSRNSIDIAHQATEVVEDAKLPSIKTSVAISYISNALVWGGNPMPGGTTHLETAHLPHYGNNFSLEATQLVFKGGLVKNSIEKSELQEQLASLNYDKNKADINLLLSGRYLDLVKLYNQKVVVQHHIELANKRLSNVKHLLEEGMLTRNDELRIQLQIANLQLSLEEIENAISVINTQMVVVLNLPANTYIQPVADSIPDNAVTADVNSYIETATQNYPEIKSALLSKQIAEKSVSIAKAEKMPSVALFAKNDMERPVLTVIPPIDQYFAFAMAGVSVGFDIGSLYKANKNINLAKMQVKQQDDIIELQKQSSKIEVSTAFKNFYQAKNKIRTLEQAEQLAQENYRIVEKKYFNQLAVITDILDASNARLDAEMQLSNAHVSLLYAYYQLQKSIGNLN